MASKAGVACPNCGSDLYKGHDNVSGENIAVCMDNSDPPNGCLAAWDLRQIEKGEEAPPGPWDAEAAPELGPPGDVEAVTNVPDAESDPTKEPFEGAAVGAPPTDDDHLQ